jgi:hypothetical protein
MVVGPSLLGCAPFMPPLPLLLLLLLLLSPPLGTALQMRGDMELPGSGLLLALVTPPSMSEAAARGGGGGVARWVLLLLLVGSWSNSREHLQSWAVLVRRGLAGTWREPFLMLLLLLLVLVVSSSSASCPACAVGPAAASCAGSPARRGDGCCMPWLPAVGA